MARVEKQEQRLKSLDVELRSALTPILRDVADGRRTDFFPQGAAQSAEGAAMWQNARVVLTLARRLGVDESHLVASKLVRAFERSQDVTDAHRLGPIRLAITLLAELRTI